MDLPIKFPSDADVIAEEVSRFRALSATDQVRTLGELFQVYEFLARASDRPDEVARLAAEEKQRERNAIKEFVARHGGN